jgi:hypothetical protein
LRLEKLLAFTQAEAEKTATHKANTQSPEYYGFPQLSLEQIMKKRNLQPAQYYRITLHREFARAW